MRSSGMGEVRWRDSTRLSSSNSPPDSLHRQYAEELQPQVAKHERLLDEETEVVEKGMQVTRNLLRWYEDRVESLQKRRRMLDKGMVALDSAVHEQKLNFHRAQITELNRRMTALMNSTKRGFPIHENMQNGLDGSENGTVNSSPPIRNAIPPPSKTPQLTPQFLLKQNQKLAEELDAKSHMIEQLQRERRLAELRHAAHFNNNNDSLNGLNGKPPIQQQRRPAAYVRPAISNYVAMPIKVHDTLL
ncbi:hypothetical protein M3Y97_00322400 [Aphelenchoides bicaudatus]|nr:hypothetical protein M3Y97_00322400 [Aphelenchoides bicaudatus]